MEKAISVEIAPVHEHLAGLLRARVGMREGGAAGRMQGAQFFATEKTIESLEARLVPLDERLDLTFARAEQVRADLEKTQRAIAGNANRVKADLLGKVLRRITVQFGPDVNPNPHKRECKFTAIPHKLVFEPLQGEPIEIHLRKE